MGVCCVCVWGVYVCTHARICLTPLHTYMIYYVCTFSFSSCSVRAFMCIACVLAVCAEDKAFI